MRKKVMIIGIIMIFLGGLLFLVLKSSGGKGGNNYKLVKAEKGNIIDKALAIGRIEPKSQISVKSQISGIVKRVFVEMGDTVREGDPLVEISPNPTPLEYAQAKREMEINSVNCENQKKEWLRIKDLAGKELVSQRDLEQAESAYEETKLRLKLSQEKLSLIEKGRTNIAGRRIDSVIKSPISGTVLEREVNVGDPVVPLTSYQEGTVLLTLANMEELIFKGTVDEIDVGKLKEGMPALLKIGALPNDTIKGLLQKISPKARREGNATLFDVEIKVTQRCSSILRAGYSANADIIIAKRENILIIPERLVEFSGDTTFVELKESPGKIVRKRIITGLSDGLNIEVKEGLKEGDLLLESPTREIE